MTRKSWLRGFLAAAAAGILLMSCQKHTEDTVSESAEVLADGASAEDAPAEAASEDDTVIPDGSATDPADEEPDLHPYDFTIDMTGDINLADNWNTMEYYAQQANGIYDCIDQELIRKMQQADLTWANVEFSISDRGEPMAGKYYTFRADPSHVSILQELGIGLANLANNHVYDYGRDAFEDTLRCLSEHGIPYVGAGMDAKEAQQPYDIEIDGKTVACVSATRAEKNILTPEAGEHTPGVFRCYDMEKLLETVREAKQQADFVIVYVHWGTEYSETLESVQTEDAHALAEAGADVVVGAHPHCLQGVEYYEGVPILYSLGNYWFNEKTLDTALLQLHFSGDDTEQHLEVQMIPAKQENHVTRMLTEENEINAWIEHMKKMSPSKIEILKDGTLQEIAEETEVGNWQLAIYN